MYALQTVAIDIFSNSFKTAVATTSTSYYHSAISDVQPCPLGVGRKRYVSTLRSVVVELLELEKCSQCLSQRDRVVIAAKSIQNCNAG